MDRLLLNVLSSASMLLAGCQSTVESAANEKAPPAEAESVEKSVKDIESYVNYVANQTLAYPEFAVEDINAVRESVYRTGMNAQAGNAEELVLLIKTITDAQKKLNKLDPNQDGKVDESEKMELLSDAHSNMTLSNFELRECDDSLIVALDKLPPDRIFITETQIPAIMKQAGLNAKEAAQALVEYIDINGDGWISARDDANNDEMIDCQDAFVYEGLRDHFLSQYGTELTVDNIDLLGTLYGLIKSDKRKLDPNELCTLFAKTLNAKNVDNPTTKMRYFERNELEGLEVGVIVFELKGGWKIFAFESFSDLDKRKIADTVNSFDEMESVTEVPKEFCEIATEAGFDQETSGYWAIKAPSYFEGSTQLWKEHCRGYSCGLNFIGTMSSGSSQFRSPNTGPIENSGHFSALSQLVIRELPGLMNLAIGVKSHLHSRRGERQEALLERLHIAR